MGYTKPFTLNTIAEYHQFRGLTAPENPLISVINFDDVQLNDNEPPSIVCNFYTIVIKRHPEAKLKYGQQVYDFDEGIMMFLAPGQVFGIESTGNKKPSGWLLLIHPDFLWKTNLASSIGKYEYFQYSVHEALFLSEKEEEAMLQILMNIRKEYQNNVDHYSHNIIIAQLELLFTYSERFYNRQFITRRINNHKVLEQVEEKLSEYFTTTRLKNKGIPTVQKLAEDLNISPNYLSGLLKNLTGMTTQQHIHNKLIETAKEKLSTTEMTVSEIAYELGFEHSQSFSKLFKAKTNFTPLDFRNSYN